MGNIALKAPIIIVFSDIMEDMTATSGHFESEPTAIRNRVYKRSRISNMNSVSGLFWKFPPVKQVGKPGYFV